MDNKFDAAVNKAKEYLYKPRDATHDINHHIAVWKNCQKIIEKENIKVNSDLVKVAAFWHDVILSKEKKVSLDDVKETVNYLNKYLPLSGFDKKEVKIITQAVLHHEFRNSPKNIEGLILQDADKLDVLSLDRWDRTLSAYKSGKMGEDKYKSYIKTGLKWLPIIESTLHYNYSKLLARRLIEETFENHEFISVFKDIGLESEFNEYLKVKNSFKTKLVNLYINLSNFILFVRVNLKSLFQ